MDAKSAWSRALEDPSLRDLPYKMETNEYGQLVMSPLTTQRGRMQSRLNVMLSEHVDREGSCAIDFAIETSKGVKAPDVVWMSDERWEQLAENADASPFAPELCVEVLSDPQANIHEKKLLYFEHGALEVWTCDADGRLRFFDFKGENDASHLVPSFPKKISF